MKTLIIANPRSGKFNLKKINKIQEILQEKCDSVSVVLTSRPLEATEIATNTDADLVISAGGDGLANEVAKGLVGSDKFFSVLPFGTANVFANEFGINLNPIKAAEKLNINNKKKISIGIIDNKIFLLMVGFGYDATVVKKIETSKKKYKNKKIAYVLTGLATLLKNNFKYHHIDYQGINRKSYHTIISIISCYAGKYKLGNIVRGKLNIFTLHSNSRFRLIKSIISMFFGLGFSKSFYVTDYVKVSGVNSCQIDGEYLEINKQSLIIKVKRDALTLIS